MMTPMWATALDLGTTNAVAAALDQGRPRVVPLRGGGRAIPAAVALDGRGRWLVGRDARAQLLSRPRETVVGMKTFLGRSVRSTAFRRLAGAASFRIVEGPDGPCADLGDARLSLVDAAGLVLGDLRGQAQDTLGREILHAVVPVPDYFTEDQRGALCEAGRRSGLSEVRVVEESECLTRLVEAAGRGRELRNVFLYGLGGGVFDATLLERTSGGRYEVVASTGEDLGGALFDLRIAQHLHGVLLATHGLSAYDDPVGLQRILEAAEAAKVRLDVEDVAPVHVPFLAAGEGGTPLDLACELGRADLVRLTGDLVRRTFAVCGSVLRAGRVAPEDLDAVFLYGRPVHAREIHAAATRFFGRTPVRLPEDAVALGAAVLAAQA